MKQQIDHILEHWNYQKALDLFKQLSSNNFLIELFTDDQNSYTELRLREELENIPLPKSDQTAAPKQSSSETVKVIPLYVKKWLQEKDHLKSQLELLTTTKRFQAALRILDLAKLIRDYYHG